MLSTKSIGGINVWASVAALGLMVGCAAQQSNMPLASSEVGGAQALPAGTTLNTGQGTYTVPALPPSATETNYALTGDDTSNLWQQPNGRWINGINGQVFVPAAP